MSNLYQIYLISDATGETLDRIFTAIKAQFKNINYKIHTYSFTRTENQILKILENAEQEKNSIILYSIVDSNLAKYLAKNSDMKKIPCFGVLGDLILSFSKLLNQKASHQPSGQYALDEDYYKRIEAIQFTMNHDDGNLVKEIKQSDIILLGVSRTSKTPTAIFLANKGLKTSNIPLITENSIPDILKQALAVSFKIELGHDYVEDSDARFEYYNKKDEKKIPFGIDLFNKVTRGGIAPKTLNCVMAGTNVGKSFFMTDFAAHCLTIQKNVLYITLEMSEEELARRIDANLLNVKINELDEVPISLLQKKLEEKSRNIKSRLIFKEFPTGRGSAADFNKLIDELELKKGFKPDILFVDYINICSSSTLSSNYKADKYLYIKTIAEELRGLAVEKNIPIFTATQTNREGYGDSDPDLTNTSESWGLPATADFMFAMMTDDQLEQLSQFRIKQLKNRYNRKDSNKRFCIGYDLMKMRLFDIDDNNVGSVSTGEEGETPSHGSSFLQKKKTLDFSGISV